jgi:hypothetical protein
MKWTHPTCNGIEVPKWKCYQPPKAEGGVMKEIPAHLRNQAGMTGLDGWPATFRHKTAERIAAEPRQDNSPS